VTGVTGPGDFAPIVDHGAVRRIGESRLPPTAPRVSLTRLLTGADDGQWVEIEGVVRSVVESGVSIGLRLALSDGNISAITVREPGTDYESLVDAKVTLRGNAGPLFNHQRQMAGSHILFPGIGTVRVEEPAPADPFASKPVPVGNLLRFTPNAADRHRAHVRGAVTLFWPGRVLCIQDGAAGLCAQTDQTTPLKTGQPAEVIGFPATGGFSPTFTNATYKAIDSRKPVPALSVTAAEAFSGKHDAGLVQIEGQLIGIDKAESDPSMVLSSGNSVFSAVLPRQFPAQAAPAWEEGSTLKITGICKVQSDPDENIMREGFTIPKSFRIMLRSPTDVLLVRGPSWWSAAHILWVLAFALFSIVLTAVALFRQVRKGRRTAQELRREMGDRERAEEATKYALDQMEYQAHHDPLTSLANRLMFDKSMRDSLASAERTGSSVGLVYLDLDRFKIVNDSLGHAAGDILLKQAAERLASVSPEDSVLARLGGDEFAFLLPGIAGRSNVEAAARSARDVLAAPFEINGSTWHCPASIGLSIFPEDARSAADLQKNADTALYRAKRTAPGEVVAFHGSMSERAERSVLVEKALRRALRGIAHTAPRGVRQSRSLATAAAGGGSPHAQVTSREFSKAQGPPGAAPNDGETLPFSRDPGAITCACSSKAGFSLVFQPQFTAAGDLCGFEALLRLNDPELGAIGPVEFIPLAELIGLIVPMGEWVLREACHQWVEWSRATDLTFSMSVNVSSLQLTRGGFPELLRNVLDQTGMPATLLDLELTETGIFGDARHILLELKAMGVRISVDDFGTGFSSLSSLHRAPVDCVKMDRSFVRDAVSTPGTLPFIRTIVALARSLGMSTVAEGVETAAQMEAVKAAGCDILQGYLLSLPLTAEKAALLLSGFAAAAAFPDRHR
jgi:diguanylate cyclase (GGDEF)-like protein